MTISDGVGLWLQIIKNGLTESLGLVCDANIEIKDFHMITLTHVALLTVNTENLLRILVRERENCNRNI